MERKLSQSDQLLQVDVNREIEPAIIDRTLLQSAGNIAKGFADIGRRKFDAVFLQRIRQHAQRGFLDGTFARVRVRGFLVVGLLVFLRPCQARRHSKRDESNEAADFQNVAQVCYGVTKGCVSHHPCHAEAMVAIEQSSSPPSGTFDFHRETASTCPRSLNRVWHDAKYRPAPTR
jgi:hypothetical protein